NFAFTEKFEISQALLDRGIGSSLATGRPFPCTSASRGGDRHCRSHAPSLSDRGPSANFHRPPLARNNRRLSRADFDGPHTAIEWTKCALVLSGRHRVKLAH